MRTAEQRVAFVIAGVVRQALQDSGTTQVRWVGEHGHQRALIQEWCALGPAAEGLALTVSAANKTELLLAGAQRADLFPLGDLYATDLAALTGRYDLSDHAATVAAQLGGVDETDTLLRALVDERRSPDEVFAGKPDLRESLMQLLERNRFHRMRIGVVPKIGARTLGIDLFI